MKRRSIIQAALGLPTLSGLAGLAAAQSQYPSKPIRYIVPVAAGGGSDMVARTLTERWGNLLKQTFVVDNLGGGGALSLDGLADALIAANGGKGRFERKEFPADRKRIDIGDYEADDRAFRAATGWTPRVDLVEGLRRSIAYYRANIARYI